MSLILIAAASENNVIGQGNRLPWNLPDDLKHFRELTRGHPVIMGRKTYQSIGRPLPNRTNIVVSRDAQFQAPGCQVISSLDKALALVEQGQTAYVIGGGELYTQALPLANAIELTRVHTTIEGDAYFPVIDPATWKRVSAEEHAVDTAHALAFTFERWERRDSR